MDVGELFSDAKAIRCYLNLMINDVNKEPWIMIIGLVHDD